MFVFPAEPLGLRFLSTLPDVFARLQEKAGQVRR